MTTRTTMKALVLGLLILQAGCDKGVSAPGENSVEAPSHLILARGIAMAMDSRDLRMGILEDMRDSEWTQHKLVLQDYLSTERGEELIRSAAAGLKMKPIDLLDLVEGLPDLDFYVPSRQQRLIWEGTSDFAVGATLVTDIPQVTLFTSAGEAFSYAYGLQSSASTPLLTHLILHPAEQKGERLVLPEEKTAETIQSRWLEPHYVSVEVWEGGSIVDRFRTLVNVDSTVSARNLVAATNTMSMVGQDSTELIYFSSRYADGSGGDCENIYKAKYNVGLPDERRITTYDNDVSCPYYAGEQYYAGSPFGSPRFLMDRAPHTSGEHIYVEVDEDDAFNNDDYGQAKWEYNENQVSQVSSENCQDPGGIVYPCFEMNVEWESFWNLRSESN